MLRTRSVQRSSRLRCGSWCRLQCPGIVASVILAFSRAIGETMLVTIAAGLTPRMTLDPRESIQTMTAYIVQLALGEAPHGSLEFQTIFAGRICCYSF